MQFRFQAKAHAINGLRHSGVRYRNALSASDTGDLRNRSGDREACQTRYGCSLNVACEYPGTVADGYTCSVLRHSSVRRV